MTRSIAVAGKGGTGKTTLAALIVLHLCETGRGPVLAVDADADANLGALLGVKVRQTLGDLREDIRKSLNELPAGMSKADYIEAGLHGIIEEAKGFDLLTMGKGEGPGCYCSLNHLIRKFSEDLMPSYAWAVFDNEAGLEHVSRRTTCSIDALLVVVTDNPLSFHTAENIAELTGKLDHKIRRQYVVTNMVRDERKDAVFQRISRLPMEHLCDIPYDPQLEQAICRGQPLTELSACAAKERIGAVVEKIGDHHAST